MIDKNTLEDLLNQGYTYREMEKITGVSNSNLQYAATKYGMDNLNQNKPLLPYKFERIDTPAKAYILGFILCDAGITRNGYCQIHINLRDSYIIEFISSIIGGEPRYSYIVDKKSRRYPSCTLYRSISDIIKFTGGPLKSDRHFPRVREDLELYLMLGVFDADGCITWGYRKDRNRIWQKITIKSSYNILYGIQQFLYNKLLMSTRIYPVKSEDCYVLEFAERNQVLQFLTWLYQNPQSVILQRKYQKANALRLELEENGEIWRLPKQSRAELAEQEGVETSGDKAIYLNNHNSIQGNNNYS